MGKLNVWAVCQEMIISRPLFGSGIHSFAGEYMFRQAKFLGDHPGTAFEATATTVTTPYNEFIHVWTEQGSFGLLLFLFLLVSFFLKTKANANRKYKAVVLAFAVFACFSYPGENIALLFGLVCCMGNIRGYEWIRLPYSRILRYAILPLLAGCIFFNVKIIKKYHLFSYSLKEDIAFSDLTIFKNEPEILQSVLQADKTLSLPVKLQIQQWIVRSAPSPATLCSLGELYEKAGKEDQAEKYYRIAAHMVPNQVRANYSLFKLYQKQGNEDKAREIAFHISQQPIKIENTYTLGVQGEIQRYLKLHPKNTKGEGPPEGNR